MAGWLAGFVVCVSMATGCDERATKDGGGETGEWEFSADPTIALGVLEGNPDEIFGRIVGVELMSDGGVAVADGQAGDVRWFGPDRRLVARAGGVGDGPGGFRRIGSMQRLGGDTVAVFDGGTGRLTTFGPTGALVRTVPLEGTSAATAYQLSYGRIIAMASVQPSWGDVPRTGLKREPVRVTWYGADGAALGVDTTYPGADIYVIWTAEPTGRILGLAPFGRWTTMSVQGGRYVVATGDSDTLKVVDAIEEGQTVLVLPSRDRRVTKEMAVRYGESLGSTSSAFPLPDRFPHYSKSVLADQELWVSSYSQFRAEPTEWFVFGLETGLPRSVFPPRGLDVRSIRGDRVAGVRTDERGFEKVEVYVLRRGRDVQ